MQTLLRLLVSALTLLLASCISASEDSYLVAYNCAIPCLESSPAVSPTAVSSSTGGTVDITFTTAGDLADIRRISVTLHSLSNDDSLGMVNLNNPVTNPTNTLQVVINAGTTPGTYYPLFDFYTESNPYAHGQYNVDSRLSTTKYHYAQSLSPQKYSYALSPFDIPVITVTP